MIEILEIKKLVKKIFLNNKEEILQKVEDFREFP